ncbi:hypothetical protein ACFVVU_09880 [Kitasatospora sp. NPDC057965]|uniref:hypothetical protein n=1 Tax=unclassified Kitasatospora TaxID=2633591 RepID=UPI0036AD7514
MRTRRLLTAIALGATLAAGVAVPASAVTREAPPSAPQDTRTSAASGGYTKSKGGPIRTCDTAGCSVVVNTKFNDDIYWQYWQYNTVHNKWYYVTYPATGWIYCGNVTAGC